MPKTTTLHRTHWMYMRGVRTTFTNDLMKDAVLNFMSQQLSDERMITEASAEL